MPTQYVGISKVIRSYALLPNCDEWNHGYFRVSELINGDWVFNDITGYDVSFWTFTNEADATMFALKWK